MAYAQLGQQRINGSCLNSALAAEVAQRRSVDVVLAVRRQERKGAEMLDDLIARFGPRKTLQQFLQHQASRYHLLAAGKQAGQFMHLGHVGWLVAPQQQRPDAGVRKQGHRDLSFL